MEAVGGASACCRRIIWKGGGEPQGGELGRCAVLPWAERVERSGPVKRSQRDLLNAGPTLGFWLEQLVNGNAIYRDGQRGNCGGGGGAWWLWFGQLKLELPVGRSNQARHLQVVLQFCPKSTSSPKSENSSSHLSQDPKSPASLLQVESHRPEISMLKC